MMGELDKSGASANSDECGKTPYMINQFRFFKRLGTLYWHWRMHKDKLWGSADFLAISTPPDDIRYVKSSTLILWLLGYEFPETTIVFGRKHIYILCSNTKASLLESVKETAKKAVEVDVVIHAILKGEDVASKLDDVLHSMLVSEPEVHDTLIVGYVVKESLKGSILDKWAESLIKSGFQLFDLTDALSDLFRISDLQRVKDPHQVSFTRKAAYLPASAMKYFVIPKLKRAIHKENEFTHSALMDDKQKYNLYPSIRVNIDADDVDIFYPPIFESGGKVDPSRISSSNDDFLIYESPSFIICAVGSQRNNNYCYVARTILIDANAFQSTSYKILLRAYEAAINAVKPGNMVSALYSAALEVVRFDDPELVSYLIMTVGTCFGLELQESGLLINEMNNRVIKAGLDYNISLGFQNLSSETGQTFSLLLGDTVVVRNDRLEVITRMCSKDVKEVSYFSNDTKEDLESEKKIVYSGNSVLYAKTRSQSNKRKISKEELIRQFNAAFALKELAREDSAAVYNWANMKTSNELIGSRHNNLCISFARKFLIDADAILCKAYTSLGRAHKAAIIAVKPGKGNYVFDVYDAAVEDVKKFAPELAPSLTKTAGTCFGIDFGESGSPLDPDNARKIKAGMVFNIVLGFQSLLDEAGKSFSIFLEDMVVVTNSGCEVISHLSSEDVKDVAYYFSYDYEDMELRVKASQEILKTVRQLAGMGSAVGDSRGSLTASNELIAYKCLEDLPPPGEMTIQVDEKTEAVLLPIYGIMVPFHIATVKRVSCLQGINKKCFIRIIFNVTETPFIPCDEADSLNSHGAIYLKVATFLSKDPRHVRKVVRKIKTLQRSILARDSERAERSMLAVPAKLELAGNNCKPIRLSHVLIRPRFCGLTREIIGALEAHTNCFRYSTSRQENEGVDIMYANIKHAFFQPSETETEKITLLHLHLHKYVKVGNKKTRDVQFYTNVVQKLVVGETPSTQHTEEETEEIRKRERDRINMEFQNFVSGLKVHRPEFKELNIEFELPMKELGFNGVIAPDGKNVFMVPTSSCLVELLKTPSFLVITLSDIEIVSLEGIGIFKNVGQKHIDMAIVFKDFKRDVIRIDSIPSAFLDGIINWLENVGIRYYMNGWNLDWKAILKAFSDDPQLFIDVGGWDFLKDGAESDTAIEPYPDSDSDST